MAETKGFRAAGERLSMSHSAVSQALRRLETRLGVALVQRTTRSVHLTDAGERLYASVRPALDEVRSAAAAIGELGDQPRGRCASHTSSAALSMMGESLLPTFLSARHMRPPRPHRERVTGRHRRRGLTPASSSARPSTRT
ncbi:MAG: LysR family transcriptional regulator [Gemmatimonadetes bacterium]|nr:LysR family transcriptional regulator [Gemmatimonadota bacterium]